MAIDFIDAIKYPACLDEYDAFLASIMDEEYFEVIPVDSFPNYIATVLKDIERWCRGEQPPDEVLELKQLPSKKLCSIQEQAGYRYVQIMMWAGEMKLQLTEERRRRNYRQVAHAVRMLQIARGEAL